MLSPKAQRFLIAATAASVVTTAVNYAIYCRVGSRLVKSSQALFRGAQTVVLDVDEVVLECSALLAVAKSLGAGVAERVADFEARLHDGSLRFEEALSEAFKALGLTTNEFIASCAKAPIVFAPGAETLVSSLRARGVAVYLISYGPEDYVRRIAALLGLPAACVFANAARFAPATEAFAGIEDRETARQGAAPVVLAKIRAAVQGQTAHVSAGRSCEAAALPVPLAVVLRRVPPGSTVAAAAASAASAAAAAAAAAVAPVPTTHAPVVWRIASLDELTASLRTDAAEASSFTAELFGDRLAAAYPSRLFWWDLGCVLTSFALAGSATVLFTRPLVAPLLGLRGSMREGPWSYRILSSVVTMPLYMITLLAVGTALGQHAAMRRRVAAMVRRFGFLLRPFWS